jgi:hypothetical protein
MSEGSRLVQLGTVGASPVNVDVESLGTDVPVKVLIGGTDYVAGPRPPGWPTRPSRTGVQLGEASAVTFAAGSTISLLKCEADALVSGGWATYA